MCDGHNLANVACATWAATWAEPVTPPGDNLGRAVVITANDGGAAWTPTREPRGSRCLA
jgi:hypothetical protein